MGYPAADRVDTFYRESERLVHFLAVVDKRTFLDLLDLFARHEAFDTALLRTYGARFGSVSAPRTRISIVCRN
jgi:hypothetical protein